MNALLRRLRLDPYIAAIMAMVAVAAVLPAKGVGKDVLDQVVHAAIAILFSIYGAKISPKAIWTESRTGSCRAWSLPRPSSSFP